MSEAPISCAKCGWGLGLGSPGTFVPCAHCGCWVTARALEGDFDSAAAGLVTVVAFALIAISFAALLAALAAGSSD